MGLGDLIEQTFKKVIDYIIEELERKFKGGGKRGSEM